MAEDMRGRQTRRRESNGITTTLLLITLLLTGYWVAKDWDRLPLTTSAVAAIPAGPGTPRTGLSDLRHQPAE
jgi:hypothetical protein